MENKKIVVCHLTSVHKWDDIRIFHKECVSTAQNGIEVHLVATKTNDKIEKGVHIHGINFSTKSRLKRFFKTSKLVYQKAIEINADIYHFHDPELMIYGLKIKKKGKKVIYDVHEDLPRQIQTKHWIPKSIRSIVSFFVEKIENRIVKKMSYVVTSTENIKERFASLNSNVSTIYNYPIIEENIELPDWSQRQNSICYVGGIMRGRGILELVNVLEENSKVDLNLAGIYSPESLKDELILMQGWSKVNDFGFVNRKEIIKILNKSKIGMVTLHPTQSYIESLPIKLFEYMYAGLPVIVSNFPIWQSIINESGCGISVDPLDVNRISSTIDYLIENSEIAEEMGRRGREAVLEKYNWKIEEEKLINIYLNLQ